jgi:hypothetical protein
MYEHIFTVLLLQKTKPLAVIEPLHHTFCHFCYLNLSCLFIRTYGGRLQ